MVGVDEEGTGKLYVPSNRSRGPVAIWVLSLMWKPLLVVGVGGRLATDSRRQGLTGPGRRPREWRSRIWVS